MGLVADLLRSIAGAPPLVAADLAVGPRFTAVAAAPGVAVPSTGGGLAYTMHGGDQESSAGMASSYRYPGRGVRLHDLAAHVPGQHPAWHLPRLAAAETDGAGRTQAALATAALNALLAAQLLESGGTLGDENGLDLIARLGAGKRLAVVGSFPHLETIRRPAAQSWVLELQPETDELPAEMAPDVLPLADVVGITGATLANGTLEGLLALCRPDAFVAVIGPTTPLSPVLFEYGVDVLCGAIVDDPALMLESVLAGGSTRRVPGTRQVSLRAR